MCHVTEKGTQVNPTASPRRHHRLAATLVAGAGLALLLAVAVAVAVAGAGGPPTFSSATVEASGVHATRAGFGDTVHPNGSDTSWSSYYSETEGGPWTLAGSGTCAGSEEACGDGVEVQHLEPTTTYYVLIEAKNASSGTVTVKGQFTTTAVSVPELEIEGSDARVTINSAKFGDEIQTNGAVTAYAFEYATSESALANNSKGGVVPPGCSGSVSVSEDYAEPECHIEGLQPETTYYVLYEASNEKGEAKIAHGEPAIHKFTTASVKPEAGLATGSPFTNVTGVSAHVVGSVYTGDSETQWRFEYATSEAGPWTPGTAGTVSSADAGEQQIPVGGDLTGLSPSSTYYVRLFAENVNGTSSRKSSISIRPVRRFLRRLRFMRSIVKRCVCLGL